MTDKLVALETQIQLLSDLHTRLQNLRRIPPLLKAPAPITDFGIQAEFQQLREIADTIRTEPVQDALRTARDSLKEDGRDLNTYLRRETRKRRRGPSPESPRPYIAQGDRTTTTVFPPPESGSGVRLDGLATYIRNWNGKSGAARMHLWSRTRGGVEGGSTRVVRFVIPDVLVAYVTLVVGAEGVLLTESVATFGPRERKSPHSESEFGVYRSVAQQIAGMVHAQGSVGLEGVVSVLGAYSGLFVARCGGCERVLSGEGHVPPVVREWTDAGWAARHVGCRLQSR